MPPEQQPIKLLIAPMRVMLILAGVLVFISGVQLFVFTEQTDRFFAWTINPPLTAAFLGGAYWSSMLLEWLAARETQWARVRVAVTAVLAFTLITLIVTLIHLDRFHFGSDDPLTRTAAWAWLIVYAVVPPVLAILLVAQIRVTGGDPPIEAPLPAWLWSIIGLQTAALLTVGAMLLVAPGFSAPLWPWSLTPLTARAIGAWLIGLGIAAAQVLREGDLMRVRGVQISSVVFVALQAIALARHPDTVSWSDPRLWGYILALASILAVNLYAWRAAESFRRL
ncbi:hypothetical protein [Roseiflexus sp.]|uniref:hypothetical protein n=1 Tax=Roseiflexus sp. TaxID=2562120 RepID=UPI00398B30BC